MQCFERDKHALTLHLVISNDGAGGANTSFYESKELAEFVELCDEEGFGEPTYESITMLSDSPITSDVYKVNTIENVIEDWDCEFYLEDPDQARDYAILLNMKRKRDVK